MVEEMLILYELNKSTRGKLVDDDENSKLLLNNSFKRVQLLIHFLKSKQFVSLKDNQDSFELIIDHLKKQVEELNKLNDSNGYITSPDLLNSLQSMLMFAIYLEDHSIIESISNPNRVFFHFYHLVNQPTKVCFALLIQIINF